MRNLLIQVACEMKRRIYRRRGAVAIMVALSAPVLLGMAGLVTDVTYWYGSRQSVQLAADAGAMAAARSGQTSQAMLQTIAINAANLATNGRYGFNPSNLSVTLTNNGSGFNTPAGSAAVTSSAAFTTVTVSAKTPAPVFFSGILGVPQSSLGASASTTLQQNIQPPSNSTLLSLTGNTGPTFHVGGLNFVPNDQVNQNFTSVALSQPNNGSGQIQQGSASYLSNNNNTVNSANTGTLNSTNAPPCTNLLGQLNAKTLDQGSGQTLVTSAITSTTWKNGQGGTVKVYFGAGTTIQSTYHPATYYIPGYGSGYTKSQCNYYNYYYGAGTCKFQKAYYTYSVPTTTDPNSGSTVPDWGAVVVTPTTIVDNNLNCASNAANTPSATCNIPAAAYCGGLTVNPGSTINFTQNGGDGQAFMILDGNAVMPNSAAPTLVAYTSADPQYSFNFGGSYVGALLNTTQTTIYPGEIQAGAVVYTTTETQTLFSGSYSYVDQVCPAGVLPDGLTSNSNAQCAGITQTTANGITNTSTQGTGNNPGIATNGNYCPQGDTCGAQGGLSFVATQDNPVTFVDTYVTSVYFKSGVPTYAKVSETSYYCYGTTCSPQEASGNMYLVTGQNINPNSNAPPPSAAQLTCTGGSANNLYNATTAANEGYSTSTSYASQTDSVQVCGSGPKLVAIASGGTVLVSAVNSSNLWMSD